MARARKATSGELSRAQRVIDFCEEYLVVPDGAYVGQRVRLRDWQRDIIRRIYDHEVPVRQAIISMGRKNAKTALTAMLVLAHLIGPEARRNGQIYSSATSREQASIVFGLAAKMVRMSSELEPRVTVRDSAKTLFCSMTGVTYRALSAEAPTAYGLSPVLVIHDELGQVRGPRSELYDALETAMGAQARPLSIIISTQAPTDGDLLSILIDDAKRGQDPRTVLILHEASGDDDPWDEATWRKANPALGDFLSLDEVTAMAQRAKRLPSFESAFRNLHLNQRVAAEGHFLTPEVWKLNAGMPDPGVFETCEVAVGIDLSARQDMTALALAARDEAGTVHLELEYFAPEDGLLERARRDRQPYDLWRDQGFLTATPGRTVDYAWVANRLLQISQRCRLVRVMYDRWRMDLLQDELNKLGTQLPLEPMGQGYKDMSPAIDEFEALALNGQLRHGGNPILFWNAANSIVTKDPAGNRKLDKSKVTGRIDGMVAAVMAVAGLTGIGYEVEPSYQMMILR